MITETVSGRSIVRYRGEPVTHDVRFYGVGAVGTPGYASLPLCARCEGCGWSAMIDGGHTSADLARLARQHAGLEDEDP